MKIKYEKIRAARLKKNYTQEYIANEIGVSQSQYSRLEKGESSLDVDKLGEIVTILEISPYDIIEYTKQKEINSQDSLEQIKELFVELLQLLKKERQ